MNAIDERIGDLVAAHRSELELLVDRALERELAQLVEERIAARNGNGGTHAPSATTKVCRGPCGRTLPVSSFDKHRRVCRDCRRQQNREREHRAAAAAEPEPPRPGGDHGG